MIEWLAMRLIPGWGNPRDPAVRRACGTLCGAAGILFNALLFAGKLIAGMLAGSIAITADAFNNLSDALTSAVTLIGFRVSGKRDDAEHPYGHGRAEYVAGLIVALAVILMGFELGRDAIGRIIHPAPAAFSALSAAILAASVAVKLCMAAYNRRLGTRIRSVALRAAAADSLGDAIATAAVLAGMVVGRFTGWNVDPWAGAAVSALILWGGVGAAREAISPLLGNPPDREFVDQVLAIVNDCDQVLGVHDLRVHDYGAGRVMLSLHAEVSADGDLVTLHDAIDGVERRLMRELNCEAVIHMDPVDRHSPEADAARAAILAQLQARLDPRVTLHDFRLRREDDGVHARFDALLPRDLPGDDEALRAQIVRLAAELPEHYIAEVTVDRPLGVKD